MTLYVGRGQETADLLRLRRKKAASLVVCQGRRRIGKSTFIHQCAKAVDHFLFFEGLAPRKNLDRRHQLAAFAGQLARQTALPEVTLDSWPQALELLASAIPSGGWTMVLLDEISWMAIGDPDFAGHLKSAWDNLLSRKPRLIVVLCGSVSSWIERNILDNTGFVGRCSLQIKLEPLRLPACNAFWRGKRVATAEKLRILSVTGGVPRYLEEVDATESAEQNIQRMCFVSGNLLYREFDQIFHDIFNRRASTYRKVVRQLADGRRTVSQLSAGLAKGRGGSLSAALHELEQAGFVTRDVSFDPDTGQDQPRKIRYRLSDNYLRFYLKYVAPKKRQIQKGLYRPVPLASFRAYDTIMGLQFENLVLANLDTIVARLGLDRVPLLNAGPYSQNTTQRRRACQIDLLLRTKHSLYVLETKLRRKIGKGVIDEVKEKIARLKPARGLSVRTGLIYEGRLDERIEQEDFFDFILPFGDLLEAASGP